MVNLLQSFWNWLDINEDEYAHNGMLNSIHFDECSFPDFAELLAYAESIVDSNSLVHSEIHDLITIMAFDNESESILEYIEDNSTAIQTDKIIELGIANKHYHARWQIAELIYRKKGDSYINLLELLSTDSHPYVCKRAKNCIELINFQ